MSQLAPIRTLFLVLAGLTLTFSSACQPQYDGPFLINKLRVMGVRAEPPQVRLGGTTTLQALVAGHDETKPLCYAWAFCPLALPLDGRFKCIDQELFVPLGTTAIAELTSAQVQEATQPEKLKKVLDKFGFPLPSELDQPDDGKPPDIQAVAKQLASFEFYVMFKIATADEFGGACPSEPAGVVDVECKDRNRCLQGYKRVSLAMLPQYFHDNPRLDGLQLNDVDWPESVTPSAAPYQEPPDWLDQVIDTGIDAELFEGYGPTALKISPKLDLQSRETIPEREDENGDPAKEELLVSWFAEDGAYQKQRTWDQFPDNLLLLPKPDEGVPKRTMSIWVVVRDGRNGTTWTRRRITSDPSVAVDAHPLCSSHPQLSGCENVTPKG